MIIASHYQILHSNQFYYAVTDEIPVCPDCGGMLKVRDSRKRKLMREDGSVQLFRLRRLQCKDCGAIHLEMPDIMVPYHRYDRESIEGAVSGSRNDCPADDATIYRWKKKQLHDGMNQEREM